MDRLAVAAAIVAVAALVALVLRRRRRPDAPTQPSYQAPSQLDRDDFAEGGHPWLLVVFTSATCHTCADTLGKARAAASGEVGVVEVEYGAERELHRRYGIDAVPTLVLADADGVVHASFIGKVTATDLWAAVAEARRPPSG